MLWHQSPSGMYCTITLWYYFNYCLQCAQLVIIVMFWFMIWHSFSHSWNLDQMYNLILLTTVDIWLDSSLPKQFCLLAENCSISWNALDMKDHKTCLFICIKLQSVNCVKSISGHCHTILWWVHIISDSMKGHCQTILWKITISIFYGRSLSHHSLVDHHHTILW